MEIHSSHSVVRFLSNDHSCREIWSPENTIILRCFGYTILGVELVGFYGDTSQLSPVSKIYQFNCLTIDCWVERIIIIWCHNCDQFWNVCTKRLSILRRTHKVTTANFACIINLNRSHSVQHYIYCVWLSLRWLHIKTHSQKYVYFSLLFCVFLLDRVLIIRPFK